MKIIFILLNLIQIYSYILPQTYREWMVIGIDKNINTNKPYHYNIGSLPMVLWYNKTNPQTIINSCNKHIGNTLKDSYVKDEKLICPFHEKSYTYEDNLGTIKKANGLIWWSYKSSKNNPPKIKEDNNNYYLKVNCDFVSVILNLICEFNGDEKNYKFHNKKLLIKKNKDYLIYKYPYTLILNNKYMMNIIPIDNDNSHIYITAPIINLNQIKYRIEKGYNEFRYKYLLLKNDNSYINKVLQCYNDYMFPDDITTRHFLINRKYY